MNKFIAMKKMCIFFCVICSFLFQNCSGTPPRIPPNVLNVPLHEGYTDKNQCMQIAMQSVIEYFLHEVYALDDLDDVTGRKNGKWTTVSQGVVGLYKLGLKVKAYYNTTGESNARKRYGKKSEKIIRNLDLDVVNEYFKKAKKNNLIEEKKLQFYEVERYIEEGYVPIMTINLNVLHHRERWAYNGHIVVVTGFNEDYVFYHEPYYIIIGPKSHKKVPKELFIKAWNANGTENSIIIVYGKRGEAG